jgi:hypothetical protein
MKVVNMPLISRKCMSQLLSNNIILEVLSLPRQEGISTSIDKHTSIDNHGLAAASERKQNSGHTNHKK